jgi:hypothetical protein
MDDELVSTLIKSSGCLKASDVWAMTKFGLGVAA